MSPIAQFIEMVMNRMIDFDFELMDALDEIQSNHENHLKSI